MNNQELWTRALSEIELSVSRANFVTWFKDTHVIEHRDGNVTVGVPNGFSKEWLENKYHKFILKSVRNLIPEIRAINYNIVAPSDTASGDNQQYPQKIRSKKDFIMQAEEQMEFKEITIDPRTNLNPKYTFETFIVGSFNEFVSSLQNNTVQNFKEKYREYDLLVVDDVQFFAGKTKTQEEFFYTFNALFDAGKQVVFSSDRPPKSIPDIEERLRSRLEAVVIIDISEPEYETRLAILKSKAAERKISLSESSLELIASMVQKNIRELEGALNTIQIQSRHQNKTLSLEE